MWVQSRQCSPVPHRHFIDTKTFRCPSTLRPVLPCATALQGSFGDAVPWRLGRPVTCVPGSVGGMGADSGLRALIDIEEWRQLRTRTEWADALNRPLLEPELRRLRLATRSGAPYGCEEFGRSLEEKTGRCLELRGRSRRCE